MSIRFRLLLSFTSVVVVSVILFVSAAYLLSVAVTGDFRSISSFYNIHYSLHPLSEEEENLFLDMKYLAKHDPKLLLDKERLEEYDLQLKMVQAQLAVRHNDAIIYSTPTLNSRELNQVLPDYEMGNYAIRSTLNSGNQFFSYAKFDFYFDEAKQDMGSIFVLRERSPFAEIVRTLLPILIIVFVCVLLLTGFLLYRYVTRKIIFPLDRLRQSAEQIKGGDLSQELSTNAGDEVGQLVMAFEDMRRKLHDSIQLQLHYEDNRKQLLSNISHDLRTPITTIKGYAEGIRDGVTNTPEKLERYVDAIHTRAADMEHLVDELLFYSKLDMNKEPFSFEQVDLNGCVRQVVNELTLEFDNHGVEIVWNNTLSEEQLYVLADREKLKRVLLNLFDNCLKYMVQSPKQITLRIDKQNEFAVVRISDNGPGIHPDSLPHIFERFYREEPSRSQAIRGSGLGLAIAKQIIEGHGGQIGADSEPGQGLALHFTLKLFEDRR
ncbi:sensor histidine kinase [Paenibacillus shunpengii]|uniref:histidine kinase n=1 Tax=Paenibacillus shunpengii TaxID=2054424 RepID=A0ABW5SJT3_9BACL